jgi:hypothetical protein
MYRAEVVKDQVGQVLRFKAPEGRPSATPTVGIKDQFGGVIAAAATTSVALDAVSTTVAAPGAALGARTLPATSVASVRIGAEYRVTNALQQAEDVRVTGIDASGRILHLASPLAYAHAAAATIVSCEFTRTLQAAEVDELGELFVATATYAVTGVENPAPQIITFDVVLHPLRSRNPLTGEVLRKLWPDLDGQEWDEQRGERYAPQRETAWEAVMDGVVEHGSRDGRGRPGMVVTADDLRRWAIIEFAMLLQEDGVEVVRGVPATVALERLDRKLSAARTSALSSVRWWERPDEDESRADDEEAPLQMDFIR